MDSTLRPGADHPPIAALFLIEFDVKAGYTVVWKQAVRGLDVGGAVEYKSLPSGLHAVPEDLVYFVHGRDAAEAESQNSGDDDDGYAGLSAFVNRPTDDADARYARMLAVGVLVPRSQGRLGRVWRHAAALTTLARMLVTDRAALPALEAYWQEHRQQSIDAPPLSSSPGGGGRRHRHHSRSSSSFDRPTPMDSALPSPLSHRLPPHHPAWSLTSLLDTFGPLVFPIYRAALLRQRILISTQAPVREVNHFVYNISVLANVPISALDLVEPTAAAQQRIRPLFTIGVHDIGFLLEDATARKAAAAAGSPGDSGSGWIACTTDRILATKEELWDVLITMPSATKDSAGKVCWPTVTMAKGEPLKATQRDLRRFRSLTTGLERLAERASQGGGNDRRRPSATTTRLFRQSDAQLADAAEAVVEPVTWAALAYNGFMWWASAGEQRRTDETDESIHDAALLADLVAPRPELDASATDAGDAGGDDDDDERAQIELAIITYFHRLTTQILSVLADLVESGSGGGERAYYDEEEEDDEDDEEDESAGGEEDDSLLGGSPLQLRRRRRGGRSSPTTAARAWTSCVAAVVRRGAGMNGTGQACRSRRNSDTINVDSDALLRMGLDVWSAGDAAFVRGLASQYFGGRAVHVEGGKGVEVCGLRVC